MARVFEIELRFFFEFSKFALYDKQGTISGGKKWVGKTICKVNIRIKFFDATLHPLQHQFTEPQVNRVMTRNNWCNQVGRG